MYVQDVGKELCHLGGWENKGSNYHFRQYISASVCVYSFPGMSTFMSRETEQFWRHLQVSWSERSQIKECFTVWSLLFPIPTRHSSDPHPGLGCWGNWQLNIQGCFVPALTMPQCFLLVYFFFNFFLAITCENESSQRSHESRCKILEQISLQH